MVAAAYKPRQAGSLKQAVSGLVDACGGQTQVAVLLNCSAQHVARMTDDGNKAEMRMAQVVLLELKCGRRIVTEYLAAEQGCIIEQIKPSAPAALPIIVGRITTEFAELLSAAAKDCQAGRLTAVNAANVLSETDDVVSAIITLRAQAREVLGAGQ
jgi:hypothetical protein